MSRTLMMQVLQKNLIICGKNGYFKKANIWAAPQESYAADNEQKMWYFKNATEVDTRAFEKVFTSKYGVGEQYLFRIKPQLHLLTGLNVRSIIRIGKFVASGM